MAEGSIAYDAVDNMNTGLESMEKYLSRIEHVCTVVESAFKKTFHAGALEELEIEADICIQNFQQIEYNINNVNKSLEDTEEKAEELSKADDKISGMFKAAAEIISKIDVSKILGASDELVQTKAKLNLMNDDLMTTDQLTQKIYASAKDARASFSGMADFVTQMEMNSGNSFGSTDEIITFGNLLQKQMVIAGASTSEASEKMIQLAQSVESGVIGSSELSSILSEMPNVTQAVADYMNRPVEEITKMASAGEITTSDLKNAMFASADEINAKFSEMPMTWEQVWQSMQDTATNKFQPVLQQISGAMNSAPFQALIGGATIALGMAASIVASIFDLLGTVAGFVYDNWSVISPVIYGVIAAMGLYILALGAYSVARAICHVQDKIAEIQDYKSAKAAIAAAVANGMKAKATEMNTVAQASFNTVLLASPITWITLLVIALVVAMMALCNWIAKTTGITQSGFGIIAGVVAVAFAAIWNTVIGVFNGILQFVWTYFFEPMISIIEFIVNAFSGGFDSLGGMIGNLMANFISWFLSFGKIATKVIDAVFGTDWTSEIEGLQSELLTTGKRENAITFDRSAPSLGEGLDYGDVWNKSTAWGDEKWGQFTDWTNSFGEDGFDMPEFSPDAYHQDQTVLENNTGQIADNTADIKDSVDISNENLKYLRDIAEREAVNRFTTAQIKVAMTNHNSINSNLDLDGVVNHLVNGVNEAMLQSAEGVNSY